LPSDLLAIAGSFALLVAWAVAGTADWASGAEAAKPAAPAAKPAGRAASSLDQELLKDLDNELLDGAQNLPAGKKPPAADKARSQQELGEAAKPGSEKPPADDEKIGEDIGEGPEDPLARIGQQMRKVEQLIERQKSANLTEPLREQIVQELAQLIAQIEKQQQQQQASSSSKAKQSQSVAQRDGVKQSKQPGAKPGSGQANQPARDSTDRLGRNETQRPDMDQMKGMMKDLWGQLPAHAREQMLQTSPEQFVPRYELLIEKYYKRLAEQQKHEP
jgi:hypothetical protein